MTRIPADPQPAAFVDETIAFELNAAAAFFQRQGQLDVSRALREQGDTLLREAARIRGEAEKQRRVAGGNAPTVLVVEDESPLLDVVSEGLSEAGFNVIPAETYGIAGLLLDSAEPIDLLLTDIRLPDRFTGWDLAERARSRFPGLPVIYVTGYSAEVPRLVDNSLLLMKPCRPSALITAMQQLGVASADRMADNRAAY